MQIWIPFYSLSRPKGGTGYCWALMHVLGLVQPSISSLAERFYSLGPWFVHSCRQIKGSGHTSSSSSSPPCSSASSHHSHGRGSGKRFPPAPSLTSSSCSAASLATSEGKMSVISHAAVSSSGWWSHQRLVTPPRLVFQLCQWSNLRRSSVVAKGCCLPYLLLLFKKEKNQTNPASFYFWVFLSFLVVELSLQR